DLANRGELTVRVYAASADANWYDQARLGLRRGFGSPSLRLGAVNGGIGDVPIDESRRTRLMAADHAGLQVCLDVRSEGGAAAALEIVDAFVRADGDRDRRSRIEHAQHAPAGDPARLAVAKADPTVTARAPEEFARFSKMNVRTAMGSDWPSSPLNPMLRLAAAAGPATPPAALAAHPRGSAVAAISEGLKGPLPLGKPL